LWARQVAAIEPAWIENAAGSLAKVHTSDPYWSKRNGTAMARQRVMVYGVTIVTDRPVRYYNIDRCLAREMFIRRALIEVEWNSRNSLFICNLERLDESVELEARLRGRVFLVCEEVFFEFYDARIPEYAVSQRDFYAWWRRECHKHTGLLDFHPAQLLATDDY